MIFIENNGYIDKGCFKSYLSFKLINQYKN